MLLRCTAAALALAVFGSSLSWSAPRKKKKNEEEVTQVLELPKDPPAAARGDATRLVFHTAPLSAKGLLSQQVRDGLKALLSQVKRAQVIRIRAFVAGSGDLRRVPMIVSEVFTDKRLALPAVSVVQVGALPLVGAQVALESIAVERKPLNPGGLSFITTGPSPAAQAAEGLQKAGSNIRQVTCYLHDLERIDQARGPVAAAFPGIPAQFVQLRRDTVGDTTVCEAVTAPESGAAGDLVFTGVQLGFGREEADIKLAFERLAKSLEGAGSSRDRILFSHIYPMSNAVADRIAKAGHKGVELHVEGLASADAQFGVDAVATVPK